MNDTGGQRKFSGGNDKIHKYQRTYAFTPKPRARTLKSSRRDADPRLIRWEHHSGGGAVAHAKQTKPQLFWKGSQRQVEIFAKKREATQADVGTTMARCSHVAQG